MFTCEINESALQLIRDPPIVSHSLDQHYSAHPVQMGKLTIIATGLYRQTQFAISVVGATESETEKQEEVGTKSIGIQVQL